MKRYMIFLLMTVLLIGLTVVSAEDSTNHIDVQESVTTTTTSTHDSNIQEVNIVSDNNKKSEQTTNEIQTTNNSHEQYSDTIQKTSNSNKNNIKAGSASEELSAIELSTKTDLEEAFKIAKDEIDKAQSTYEKEQVPIPVIQISNQIAEEAARAETIYAESGDETLLPILNNIRNNAGYADLLIHPEKLTDPVYAKKYNTRPLDMIDGKYNLLTIVAQRLNQSSQESVYINLTSDEFQNLYNDVGEIHHPGEYDRYGHVILVNKTKFVGITSQPTNFELIPFPLARIYLEGFYYKGMYYTQTFASCANGTGWYHVDGSTLTKAKYMNYTTNQEVEGNSGIVFWKMIKSNTTGSGYELTDERFYPDIYGYPPDNMPKENNDDNGIYFVGYVIKTETGGIHIDGVIVEYRAPEQTYDVNFTTKKIWNDTNNQDGLRPQTVTIQLLADGSKYGDNIVLYAGNNWTYNYVNLPRYNKDGDEIIYTIHELSIPTGYTVSYDNYTVINTHIPEKTQVEAIKEWDDNNNRDGIRPTTVTVNLYKNGKLNNTATLSQSVRWRHTFANLDKYENGKLITYTITENPIDNRYTSSIRNVSNQFIITNKHIPAVKNVTVNKIWNDSNNQDGIRPSSIRVQLLANNEPYQNAITLTAQNNWAYTFTNLPVNSAGTPINYSVIETNIPAGYTAVNNGLNITNTHIPEKTQVEAIKVWDDDNNRDGIRPTTVTVNLYKNGVFNNTATLNQAKRWRHTFSNLDKYENGNLISYTITENPIARYNTTIRNTSNEFVITNKHVPETINITVNKVWNDSNNQDGIRPTTVVIDLRQNGAKLQEITLTQRNNWTQTITNLPKYQNGQLINYTTFEENVPAGYTKTNNGYTIINTHIPETTQVEVIKEWDDNYNADGLRPNNVTVSLLADGKVVEEVILNIGNGWRHDFLNLATYANGNKIKYTVQEKNVANYNTTITEINGEFIIKNSHIPAVKDISVIKVWDDHDNEHETRPESIQVQLYADGEKYGDYVSITASNDWKYTYTNLPSMLNGKDIVYYVEEIDVPEEYITNIGYTGENEITITNIFDPEHTQVEVIKEWDDYYNADGIRPSSVEVQLYADGEKEGDPVTLSSENYWRYEFNNLIKYNNNDEEIEYTVEEVGSIEGYDSNIVTIMKNEYLIVNTHIPEKINITINKVWEDKDNQDGIRPPSVSFELLANGEEYGVAELSEDNGWSYTFTNLTKKYNGEDIIYNIYEIGEIDGYTETIDGFTITNVHIPETTQVEAIKVWDDDNNRDGIRPTSVTVNLYKNGVINNTATLTQAIRWRHTFTNLDKYENGNLIQYTITENPIDNYNTSIRNVSNEFVITNKHIPETTNITVNKVWEDNNDQDGIRPSTVVIDLRQNGAKLQEIVLSEQNNWTQTITNLPKYQNGQVINYTTFEEIVPTGYTKTNNGHTIINTHIPETTEIHVVKEWYDDYNRDGLRPNTIEVQLLANDDVIENIILSDDNNWMHIFQNLPKYENGNEIRYTATEVEVDEYNTTITYNDNKIIINNVHIPETINITVNKVWEDNNDQDGIRPDTVIIDFRKNGVKIQEIVLSEQNNWAQTITNLPKYQNGQLINYTTFEETVPTGYTKTNNGHTIINTHTPESIDVIVIVEWDDLDNIDEIRPDNVTIILYKDGEPVDNITISPNEDWRNVFEDLPKYDDGKLINYTADEILPNGYTRTIDLNEYKIIITNIHRPEEINLTVTKVWDDNNNQDNLRPDFITIELLADGKVYSTVTVRAADSWEYPFINLPKSKKGVDIVYTIRELDSINNYTTSVDGYVITNKHDPETVDVKVNVEWDDLNDTDKIRPENVTIILYKDDEPIKNVTITPDDDWKTIFEDLPKYENGTIINYTADEILPNGYNKTIEITDYEINITNIHRPEPINVTVNVIWDDLDDVDGIRPENVTIILYENDEPIKNVTITPDDDWKTIFENLPKYDEDGTIINYTADEILPNGYTRTIEITDNEINITNIHRPEPITINVDIVWDDLEDIDGIRPENVTIILYENGKPVQNVTVTKDTWKTTFDNLPKYDENNNPITYTINEVLPNGYTKTIESNGNNFTVTNIHRPKLVWTWKLVEIIDEDKPINDTNGTDKPVDKKPAKVVPKETKYNNKYWSNTGVKSNYNKYSSNRYSRYNRYNKAYNSGNKYYPNNRISKHLYRLYIQLYNEYLAGHISFADFIVLLEKEGMDTQILNFNEDGTITIDYDNIEDVPDKITVKYKNDDIPSTSDNIDVSNPDKYDAPVIDAGTVKVPESTHSSSSSANSGADNGVEE